MGRHVNCKMTKIQLSLPVQACASTRHSQLSGPTVVEAKKSGSHESLLFSFSISAPALPHPEPGSLSAEHSSPFSAFLSPFAPPVCTAATPVRAHLSQLGPCSRSYCLVSLFPPCPSLSLTWLLPVSPASRSLPCSDLLPFLGRDPTEPTPLPGL